MDNLFSIQRLLTLLNWQDIVGWMAHAHNTHMYTHTRTHVVYGHT